MGPEPGEGGWLAERLAGMNVWAGGHERGGRLGSLGLGRRARCWFVLESSVPPAGMRRDRWARSGSRRGRRAREARRQAGSGQAKSFQERARLTLLGLPAMGSYLADLNAFRPSCGAYRAPRLWGTLVHPPTWVGAHTSCGVSLAGKVAIICLLC